MKRGSLYRTYEISGLNLGFLISELHRKGVTVYNTRLFGSKKMILTVDYCDRKKIFAICNNMCYNVKKSGESGKLKFPLFIFRNPGLAAGCALFVALLFYADSLMFTVEYKGDAIFYKKEIEAVLSENNIKKFTPFLSFDTVKLENEILLSDDEITFVTVKKQGYRLVINAVKGDSEVKGINVSCKNLYSPFSGTVLKISVLRGTAQIKAGDAVKEGDLLVGGYYTYKEEQKETYVLAEISLKCEYVYVYESAGNSEKYISRAKVVAAENLGDKEIISSKADLTESDGKYLITVHIFYEEIVNGG